MAFVTSLFPTANSRSFTPPAVSRKARTTTLPSIRMVQESETASSEVGVAGKSLWKENFFTGGFPGGEAFFNSWKEDGMTKDVPDMPATMQPSTQFKSKEQPKDGILARLDGTEFFKAFVKSPDQSQETTDASEPDPDKPTTETQPPTEEGPDPALYENYQVGRRNLAPDINIVYEKDFAKDRVYMAMTEVTASPTDLYYPKETKNKAPVITLSYNGSLAAAYVKVALEEIESLPTLPSPAKEGEAVTEMVQGSGGGLKLQYSVVGAGKINI